MRTLRKVPKTVWLLAGSTFFQHFVSFTFIYFFVYLTDARDFPVAQAGVLSGIGGAGMVAGNFTGGWFGDRFGHRRVLITGAAVTGLAYLSLPVLPVALLYVALPLGQYAGGTMRAASAALVAVVVPEGERRQAFAVWRLAANAGVTVGPPLGALLIAYVSYGWLFAVEGLAVLAVAAYSARVLPAEGRRRARTKEDDAPRSGVWAALRARPGVLLLLGATLLTDMAYRQQYSTLPVDLGRHGLDTHVYGWLIAINGGMILLLELPATLALRKHPPLRIFGCGLLLVGAGYAVLALGVGLGTAIGMMLLLTLGEILYKTPATAYVADQAPEGLQGRFQSLYAGVSVSGVVLAPPLGGGLYELAPGMLWEVCAGLAAVAGVVVLAVGPRLGRQAERVPVESRHPVLD
ncbi:MFS transporter [Streptomyces sp. A7024]|uniref:MFS transporter n=1 Tax=Streptomyces coryli TaxID=1128680 RepID=A0A6G4U290_9ACTN|nr:MFS transporter [Streptomyces coryli]NGN65488.1 MFS transporter [Streptomyces coryli]